MNRCPKHKTERRTPAEKRLAEELQARAVRQKPDPEKFRAAARLTKAAMRSPLHEYNRDFSVIDQLPIKRFYDRGDTVVGILGEPGTEMYFGQSYPLALDDGRVIRLPGNAMLHKLIKKTDAIGKHVRITYEGKKYYRYGQSHYMKTYSIEEVPLTPKQIAEGSALAKAMADAGVEVTAKRSDDPAPLFAKKGGGSPTESPEVGRTQKYLKDLHEQEAAFRREKAAKGNRRSLGMRERA